jgi:DNA polymerase III delta prime subunit
METHHAFLLRGNSIAESSIPLSHKEQSVDVLHFVRDTLSIDDARELSALAQQTPFLGEQRTFVIQTRDIAFEAQNALLKLFEEPPKHAVFYVVLPTTAMLLPTLLSRLCVSSDGTTHEGEQNDDFADFVKASYANRLALIAEKTKNKDQAWIENILRGCEGIAASPEERSPFLLESIVFVRSYVRTKGASAKMLLEELALRLPSA